MEKDIKFISLRVDETVNTGVNRYQVKTDNSRKFITGFSLRFLPKTDTTGKYYIAVQNNSGIVVNRVPIEFFNKDQAKLKKEDLFFPIHANANGDSITVELERVGSGATSGAAVKLDVVFTTSNTQQTETYILQHEVIKAA